MVAENITTKTEARQDLGVRTIIEDDTVYDYLKVWATFVRIAGYSGFVANIDELVVLSERLNHAAARNNNYEAILRIVNDCLQGNVSGLIFLLRERRNASRTEGGAYSAMKPWPHDWLPISSQTPLIEISRDRSSS